MMDESLNNNSEKQILEWASDQLSKGEFPVVLSGEKLDFAVNLLGKLRDGIISGKRKLESHFAVPNEIFLEFVTTKNLDRQNICMFTILKQAGFDRRAIETYFLEKLIPKYRDVLHFPPERITAIEQNITNALNEVFPTLN